MYKNLFLVVALFCTAAVLFQQTDAVCGACESNSAACINKTSFHLCIAGNAQRNQVFNCGAGEICSRSDKVCVAEGSTSLLADCAPTKGCGVCQEGAIFTCTSRTTFAQCDGKTRTVRGKCPAGFFCSASTKGSVCVPATDGEYDCESLIEIA